MAQTFVGLPVEVFHLIIDELHENGKVHRDHLRNLRLACRQVQSKTRIRFGQGYFHTIVLDLLCIPDDFVRATNILQDKWFREYVQQVDLRVGHPNVNFEDGQERVAILDRGSEDHFAHQFADVLTQTKNVKRLRLVGSLLPPEATLELRNKVMTACHSVAVYALHALSAQNAVHIEELELGRDHVLSPAITALMLQHVSSHATAFTELTSLNAFMAVGAEHPGVPLPINSPTAGELLTDFLSLTPKLRTLRLMGGNAVYNVSQAHFAKELLSPFSKQPPALRRLQLENISFAQVQFAQGLLKLGVTLEELHLKYVRIVPGTWQAVFRTMRQLHRLSLVELDDLDQGTDYIVFEKVTDQRPFMVDQISALTQEEYEQLVEAILMEASAYEENDVSYLAKDKDMRDAIADGWIWVSHDSTHGSRIILDAGTGDDMEMWLAMVEQQHEVRSI